MVALGGQHPALGGALQVAFLNEKRFMDLFERLGLLAHGHRDRAHADGPAPVVLGHDAEHAFIHLVEAGRIDFEQLEGAGGDGLGDVALGAFEGVVADEIDQVVRDARRAAGALGDFLCAAGVGGDVEQSAAALYDRLERGVVVIIEPGLQGETRTQGCGEEAAARGGADQGETRNREAHAAGVGPLVDHDVEAEILHRGVEVFLDGLGDAVDFVDEEDVALFEIGEQAREVAGFLDHGARGHADTLAELVAEDEGERGLAETGRARKQDVIQRIAAALRGADHDLEALDGFGLAHEIGKRKRAQRGLRRRDRCGQGGGDVAEAPGR